MTVGNICTREVDLAKIEETAQAAARRMAVRQVGTLVIVDEGERPRGILTDRDIALRVVAKGLDPATTSVESIMTPDPTAVRADIVIPAALEYMQSLGVRRLPVVDDNGKLVGIVSVDDVFMQLANEMRQAALLIERSSPTKA